MLGQRHDPHEGVFEDGVDQFLFGGKVTVERSHPQSGVVRDLLDGNLDALARKQLTRARDQPLPVPAGVAAQLFRPDGGRHLRQYTNKRSNRSVYE